MTIRFYVDPISGLPHIYDHDVNEDEVEEALANSDEDRSGSANSRMLSAELKQAEFSE